MLLYMQEKTLTEQESIRKIILELFRQTCVLKTKCDPVTLAVRDNPGYQLISKHRAFIEDYLAVLGIELCHEPQEQIYYLQGEGLPTEHLNLFCTKLVLLLKLIHRDKILGNGLGAITTNLSEIREYGRNTGLLSKKNTMTEWQEALSVMKVHQLIELPGAVRNVEDLTPIYINATISLILRTSDLSRMLRSFKNGEEPSEEDLPE